MAKKVTGSVKLQIAAGKATPAPPVGPALGQAQINIMEFCKQFNARTNQKELEGLIVPVVVTVYSDRSFTFITKTPPASVLLKRAAGIATGETVLSVVTSAILAPGPAVTQKVPVWLSLCASARYASRHCSS